MKQRFRPQRSVSLLHGIIRIAMIKRNSVIAVCTPFTLVSRSSLMSAIITFMFEPAKLQMNCGQRERQDQPTRGRTRRQRLAHSCGAFAHVAVFEPALAIATAA